MSKFKALPLREKIGYIRDYYAVHIIAVVIVASLLGWGLNHYIFNPPPRTFINISFMGQFVSEDLRDAMSNDLNAALVPAGINYAVIVDNFFTTEDPMFNMAMSQRMVAMATAAELDVFILAPEEQQEMYEAGFARNLQPLLSEAEFARLYDMGALDFGVHGTPYGLRLAHLPYFVETAANFGTDFDDWVLIVLSNSGREDAITTFLDHLLFFSLQHD